MMYSACWPPGGSPGRYNTYSTITVTAPRKGYQVAPSQVDVIYVTSDVPANCSTVLSADHSR